MKKYGRWALLFLTLGWCLLIFSFSLAPGSRSAAESGRVREILNGFLSALGSPVVLGGHFVRKLAHFAEYFVLGVTATATLWGFLGEKGLFLIPLPPFLVALTDEQIIQRRVPGRGPSFLDVALDTAGGVTGALAFFCIFLLFWHIRREKTEKMRKTS